MEQLVILIIIGLISLVNWVLQKSAEKREQAKLQREAERAGKDETRRNVYTQTQPVRSNTPPRRPPAQDPFKELMEALGLPPDELRPPVPPRLPKPDFEEEEIRSMEEAVPPPLHRVPPVMAPHRPQRPDEKTMQLASAFAAGEHPPARGAARVGSVRSLLTGRASQRQAIILAEILGPPRALSPGGV